MLGPFLLPYPSVRAYIPMALLCVNLGHTLSPIALAWTHRGFRQVMLQRPRKYIGLPALALLAGLAAALSTWALFPSYRPHSEVLEKLDLADLAVPFVVLANVYALWNLYHSGAQNFGILCIYRQRGYATRRVKMGVLAACILVTVIIGHEIPALVHSKVAFLLCFGLITINHWLAAIGLSSHVWAQHYNRSPVLFAGGVILVGSGVVWLVFRLIAVSPQMAVLALGLRAGLGIWHFLQDRWVWKLSDPEVRATIGRDLLKQREAAPPCKQMAPTGIA
jgi:hypothetical protein